MQVLYLMALKRPGALQEAVADGSAQGAYAVSRRVADAAVAARARGDAAASQRAAEEAAGGCD